MPRTYRVTFEKVTVSAAQDLMQIKGASGKMLFIKRQWVNAVKDTALPTAQMLTIRSRLLPSTVTDGSGGSSPTPRPVDPGDAAATFTAKANNTTQATTSGTAATVFEGGDHVYSGHEHTFDKPPIVPSSTSFVFELLDAPAAAVILSGGVEVEEVG